MRGSAGGSLWVGEHKRRRIGGVRRHRGEPRREAAAGEGTLGARLIREGDGPRRFLLAQGAHLGGAGTQRWGFLVGELAGRSVGHQDELEAFLLLLQFGDLRFQFGFFFFQLVGFLVGGWEKGGRGCHCWHRCWGWRCQDSALCPDPPSWSPSMSPDLGDIVVPIP